MFSSFCRKEICENFGDKDEMSLSNKEIDMHLQKVHN